MLKSTSSVLVLLVALLLSGCDLTLSGGSDESRSPGTGATDGGTGGTDDAAGASPGASGDAGTEVAVEGDVPSTDVEGVVEAEGVGVLTDTDCLTPVTGWRPSANARLARSGDAATCILTRRPSPGAGDVSATSEPTTQVVEQVGTRVHAAGLVAASEAGRSLQLTLQEIGTDGRVVQSFTGRRDSTLHWTWRGAVIRTKKAGSTVRVVFSAEGLGVGASMRFTQGSITIGEDEPAPTEPTPTPTKPTPTPTKPTPTPTATPTKPTPTPTKPTPTATPTTPAPTATPTTPAPTATPTTPTPTPTATPRPEAPVWLANTECEDDTEGWRATANAVISDAGGTDDGCRLTRRLSGGAASVTAYSALSERTVNAVGSRVHVASLVSASEAGRLLKITLQEVEPDGDVVQSFTGQRESGLSWTWVGAEIRSQVEGSHVRVVYSAEDLSAGAAFAFKEADVTVTRPSSTPPTTAPSPTPTAEPSRSPTTPVAEPTTTCDDLNDPSRRTLAFADEFTGSTIDDSKWRVRDDEHLSFDAAYLRKENVVVGDGVLTIEGRRAASPYKVSTGITDRWYTTGYVDSIGKFSQKYGRWEMRAKLPTSTTMTRGVWPAFWLRGDDTFGEIDIMEAYGGESTQRWNPGRSYTSTLWEDTNLGKERGEWYTWAHDDWETMPLSSAVYQDFHTYGFNWTPDCMQFTYDDEVVETIPMSRLPWAEKAFDSTFNIRLNMQVGSPYWGMPDPKHTKDRFDYVVDHVKVYRMNR